MIKMATGEICVTFLLLTCPIWGQMMGGWRQANKSDAMVVSGINYKLELRVGPTDCRKGRDDHKDLATECNMGNGGVQVCQVRVYDQSWTGVRQVQSIHCNADRVDSKPKPKPSPTKPDKSAKPRPGGKHGIDENTEESKNALDFAQDELNKKHDQPKRAMISDVISVHKQTVAGVKYTIKMYLGESVCDNNEANRRATISQCPLAIKPEIEECEIQVLHQAWRTPAYQLLNPINCKQVANPVYYKGKMLTANMLKSKHADATMNQSGNDILKPLYGGDDQDTVSWGAFAQYMNTFNKNYADRKETESRYKIFRDNMLKAKRMTEKDQGTAVYGANEFSDMSEEEFARYYLNPKWDTSYDPSLKPADIPSDPAPAAFDWRDHGAVSEVKNQGTCGSCWAFSTTGNIEGQWAIKTGKLLSLSEQELVDCDKLDQGCEGGLPSNAYKEIRRLGGLETEKKYPYEGEDDKCAFKISDSRVYINGSLNITKDEEKMAQWLAKNGPISIGINALMMQFYFGGVSHPFKFLCDPDSLDHGVLIVGYGTKKGYFSDTPYWIVKNSWGGSWGEKGYYLVYRGDGTCGLNQMCTSAEIN